MRGLVDNNSSTKANGINKPLELHKSFLQKIYNRSYFLIGSSCQPCLVPANFLLVAWNGSMLLFWSRSGKETRSLFAFPLNGRDSLLLFWLALLYSPSYLDKNILSPSLILQKYSETISICVLAKFQSHFIENILWQFHYMSQPKSNRISSKIF